MPRLIRHVTKQRLIPVEPFVVLVCGGRDFNQRDMLFSELDYINEKRQITKIVHGGAKGADRLAGAWAKLRLSRYRQPVYINSYPADWNNLGKSAGYVRNQEMYAASKPDLVVAAPGGRGTAMMVRIAQKGGTPVHFIEY